MDVNYQGDQHLGTTRLNMYKIQKMTRFYQSPILAAGLASAGKLRCDIADRRAHIKAAIHGGTSRFTPVDLPQYHAAIALEHAAGIATYDRYWREPRHTENIDILSAKSELQLEERQSERRALVDLFHKETIRASIAHVYEVNPRPTGSVGELFNRSIDGYGSWEIFPYVDSLHYEQIHWNEPVEEYLRTYVAAADQLHDQPYPCSSTREFEVFQQMCTADEFRCAYYRLNNDDQESTPPWNVHVRLVYYVDAFGNDRGVPLGASIGNPTYTPNVRTTDILFTTHCIERYTRHPFKVTNWKMGLMSGKFNAMNTIMNVECSCQCWECGSM